MLWISGRMVALGMGVCVYGLEYTISGCLLWEGSRGTLYGKKMSLGGGYALVVCPDTIQVPCLLYIPLGILTEQIRTALNPSS